MDLSSFDPRQKAADGVIFDLVIDDQTIIGTDGKPVTFTVKGIHDKGVRRVWMASAKKTSTTPEQAEAEDMKLAKAAVIGWSENFTVDGKSVKSDPANIPKVFDNPVVRASVLAKIVDLHAFMKGS